MNHAAQKEQSVVMISTYYVKRDPYTWKKKLQNRPIYMEKVAAKETHICGKRSCKRE